MRGQVLLWKTVVVGEEIFQIMDTANLAFDGPFLGQRPVFWLVVAKFEALCLLQYEYNNFMKHIDSDCSQYIFHVFE